MHTPFKDHDVDTLKKLRSQLAHNIPGDGTYIATLGVVCREILTSIIGAKEAGAARNEPDEPPKGAPMPNAMPKPTSDTFGNASL